MIYAQTVTDIVISRLLCAAAIKNCIVFSALSKELLRAVRICGQLQNLKIHWKELIIADFDN